MDRALDFHQTLNNFNAAQPVQHAQRPVRHQTFENVHRPDQPPISPQQPAPLPRSPSPPPSTTSRVRNSLTTPLQTVICAPRAIWNWTHPFRAAMINRRHRRRHLHPDPEIPPLDANPIQPFRARVSHRRLRRHHREDPGPFLGVSGERALIAAGVVLVGGGVVGVAWFVSRGLM